jgi:prepilin-type N-terminal cleavage/methylation domain-containing protein
MEKTKPPSASRKFKGFTLVELIVVITILAILGTIGFLAIGGYSSRARDSARIGDLAQVSKSLDLSTVISGSYPLPDGSFAVTYSGGAVWNQGTVGALVMQYFKGTIAGGGLNKKPLDPLKNTEYGYSSLAEGKAYQLKAEYEGDLAQNAADAGFLAGTAHAEAGNPSVAYVRGNFGGLTAKVSTGGFVYVLAIPSILTNSGGVAGASAPIGSLSGSLLFNGKALRGASTFPPGAVVHSGAKTVSNPSGLPASAADLNAMVAALQAAYAGSDIRSNQNIATLMNASSGSFASFGTSLVSAQLGGGAGGGNPSITQSQVSEAPLYAFTSHTFTNCGVT